MSRKDNKKTGNYGEKIACQYLEKKHYQILEKNFLSYRGEIDIIALDKDCIVFVEVKTRTQSFCGLPSEAVNRKKKRQLYKVAEYFIYLHHWEDKKVRFDVIEVYLYGSDSYHINHLKDIIWESPFG